MKKGKVIQDFTSKTIFLDTAPLIYFIEGHSVCQPILSRLFDFNDKGGFSFITSSVTTVSVQQGAEIKLQLAPALMGEVIVVGYISPKRIKRKDEKENKKHHEPFVISSSILAYPNPVVSGSKLNVQCRSLERGSYSAELYTLSGQLVQATKAVSGKEGNQISLPIGQMFPGTYLLRLTHEKSGKQLSQQVVVQN